MELFREDRVSLDRAPELCRTPLAAFMDFVAAHNVSPIGYCETELEQDRQILSEFRLWTTLFNSSALISLTKIERFHLLCFGEVNELQRGPWHVLVIA